MDLSVEALARRRWEIRGRPGHDAAHDWRGAERLRHDLIEEAAYFRWIRRGRPFGDPDTDWFAAETEVAYGRSGRPYRARVVVDERLRHQIIEELAYSRWVERGRPLGDPEHDWYAALADLTGEQP